MILRNLSLVLLVLSLKASLPAMAQEGDTVIATRGKEMNIYAEDNETNCLVCHGKLVYTLTDTLTGTVRKQLMSEHNLVVPDLFYSSVHWSFSCLDCHSEGFKTFPHPLETRFETTWGCIDCHGYDPNYAQYRFEEIDQEYQRSVHYTATEGLITCWKCHDPHYYNPLARQTTGGREYILRSNEMCLRCHGNSDIMGLINDENVSIVLPRHEWLPDVDRHMEAVRCIDCHTRMNDSVLVAHEVMPADSAVSGCADCHSKNSILMGTLYKYAARESRDEKGFINGVILRNESYVIGANRSKFISFTGLFLIGMTIAFAMVHTIFRIIIKPKEEVHE
ncbi:MAG: NapC/NirT family cytochrome c [Bacteroidales bacterium]|jgi:Zn finger protein HypA/HybF involved in hydrogenase expression|nr:NapC/NirT family cytochrome c [Bacteroidales bacterium]